jgi:nucleotide-binding universal stress UspA family protein
METLTQPILVGVTGIGENTEALRFAITEARSIGCGVTLVHAVHPVVPPPPPGMLITDDTWAEVGAGIVADVRHELEGLLDGEPMTVSTLVHHGPAGATLTELSKRASKVVLQHRALSRLHRLVTGSTFAAAATFAHCPVVSVPAKGAGTAPTGVITVGVHDDGGPREVLAAAFAEASQRGCGVRLLHAWQLPNPYGNVLMNNELWSAQSVALINSAVAALELDYPDVPVTVEVRYEWPADALAQAAAASDLLVVGRHSSPPGLPPRLGSLTRSLAMHASCPVMVVPR